ncbi:MAG TPA: ABC transporter permease [Jiangellaceae bacterium]|nr:ABC transporter permease [Jiangellaceae bacterium]
MSRALSFPRAMAVVARREFVERARDRSFLISTLVTVGIIGLLVLFPRVLAFGTDDYQIALPGDDGPLAAAVQSQAELADVTVGIVPVDDVREAEEAVETGRIDAYLADGAVVVERELPVQLRVVVENAHATVAGARALADAGIDPAELEAALADTALDTITLDPAADERNTRGVIAFIGSLILYGQLIGYSFWVALGVVEEKSSRVVELLLSAIPARALLAGKVFGIGLLGLAQLLFIAACGVGLAVATGALSFETSMLAPIGLVLGWFVLGYTAYSCLTAAAAARISRQEELQNATTPVTMLALVSFFAAFYAFLTPTGTTVSVVSMVPPVSALAMPIRMARGDAVLWEIGLALALMLLLIAGLIAVAGRVYEGAVLRMGAKVPLTDAWRSGRRNRTGR